MQSGLRKWRRLALSQHAPRIFVKGASLRKRFDGLLHLRVFLEVHLVARGQAEDRDKDFFLDLSLDPIEIGIQIGIGVTDVLLLQEGAEGRKNRVVHLKVLGDLRLGAEEIGGEITDAALVRKENFVAKQ